MKMNRRQFLGAASTLLSAFAIFESIPISRPLGVC